MLTLIAVVLTANALVALLVVTHCCIYLQPNTAAPLDGTGSFAFNNWASYPLGDVGFANIAVFVVPAAAPVLNVLGGPLPSAAQAGAVATRILPRGTTPDAAGGGGANGGGGVTPPATGGGLSITATTPAVGSVGVVTGKVTGASRPAALTASLSGAASL